MTRGVRSASCKHSSLPGRTTRWDCCALAPGWIALGAAGSVLLTVAGARLAGGSGGWWFHPELGARDANTVALYVGMALLSVAWLGLWRHASAGTAHPRELVLVGVLWSLPLVLGAPLFSHDVYSYLAQGTIAHLGLSPYHAAPSVLGSLGHAHVMNAVDPFWRHATAPYGPLFLAIMSGIATIAGSHLIAGVLLTRIVALAGLVLVWVFVPRLARAAGADPTRAVWLAALSPLVLLQLVSPSHNDLLMVGLLVAGVTFAAEGRPLLGIAICAVAMTIKLPAALAVGVHRGRVAAGCRRLAGAAARVAATAARGGRGGRDRQRRHRMGAPLGVEHVVLDPARVRLAITPATNVAWTLSSLLRDVGVSARFLHVESVTRAVAGALAGALAIVLLVRARRDNMVRLLGLALVALALGGPAAWPWYFTWGIVAAGRDAAVPAQPRRAGRADRRRVPRQGERDPGAAAAEPRRRARGVPARSPPPRWYAWSRRRRGRPRLRTASLGARLLPRDRPRSSPG